jgi:hypothetical protein
MRSPSSILPELTGVPQQRSDTAGPLHSVEGKINQQTNFIVDLCTVGTVPRMVVFQQQQQQMPPEHGIQKKFMVEFVQNKTSRPFKVTLFKLIIYYSYLNQQYKCAIHIGSK